MVNCCFVFITSFLSILFLTASRVLLRTQLALPNLVQPGCSSNLLCRNGFWLQCISAEFLNLTALQLITHTGITGILYAVFKCPGGLCDMQSYSSGQQSGEYGT